MVRMYPGQCSCKNVRTAFKCSRYRWLYAETASEAYQINKKIKIVVHEVFT